MSINAELLRSTIVHLNDHSDEDDFVNTPVFPSNHIFKSHFFVTSFKGRFVTSLPPSPPDPMAAVGPPLDLGATLSIM
jgi:hypothetical protein